jgi:hypothetical protein
MSQSRVVVLQTTDLGAAMTEPESYTMPSYVSVDITPQFWGGDMLKLVCNTGDPGTNTLAEGMFIWLPDEGNKIFWIEHVVTSRNTAARVGSTITASGRSLDGFIDTERIIVPAGAYDSVATVAAETAIKHYVNACAGTTAVASRQIPNFATVTDAAQGSTVTLDARYRTLGETLRHIGFLAGIGWYTYLDITTGLIMFDVIVPTDRSTSVILDFDLGTINEWDDEQNLLQSHSVAYVGGQGYLAQRTVQIRFQAGEPTGLGRRESFVSAGDIASTDAAGLNARGDAFLAANAPTRVTKAQITPNGAFQPNVDFFLGDLVEMTDTEAGTTILDRITSWTKHIENSAAAPTYEVSVGKPFPKADPDEVVPGVAVSDTTVVASLVAGLITAGSITSNTITADKFAATLALVSKIIAGNAIASRIELDQYGFRAYDASGNQTINIPTDGTASTFTGAIIAATLEATGLAAFDGTISNNKLSVETLQAGVQAPTSAPILSIGWPTALTLAAPPDASSQGCTLQAYSNAYYDAVGGGGTDPCVVAVGVFENGAIFSLQVVEWKISDGSIARQTVLTGLTYGAAQTQDVQGITRIGTSWYIAYIDGDFTNRVWKVTRSTGAQSAVATRSAASAFYVDIKTDGTNLYLLDSVSHPTGSVDTWATTPAYSSSKTLSGVTYDSGVLYSMEDDGTNWWIRGAVSGSSTNYMYVRSTGANTALHDFPSPASATPKGVVWDSTSSIFRTFGWDGVTTQLVPHTSWDWTTDNTIRVAYSWLADLTGKTGTAAASTDLIAWTGHGLVAGDIVRFSVLTSGTGLALATNYYVIAAGLDTNHFSVSATLGGSAIDITVNYTVVTGASWETAIGLRATKSTPSTTFGRRKQLTVTTSTIPVGGAADPNKVRIYMLQSSSDTGAGTYWLQVTDALTVRTLTGNTASGTHDGAGTAFPGGAGATLQSSSTSQGFTLKGNGAINYTGTTFPTGPATNDHYYRSDLQMEFYYDGTLWLSDQLFVLPLQQNSAATPPYAAADALVSAIPTNTLGTRRDVWVVGWACTTFVNTPNDGTHYWTISLSVGNAGDSFTTAGDTVAIQTLHRRAIGALTGTASGNTRAIVSWAKTSTPGTIYLPTYIEYRQVAT